MLVFLMGHPRAIKRTALVFTAIPFLLSLLLAGPFVAGAAGGASDGYGAVFFPHRFTWIASAGNTFRVGSFLGIDGLSMPLVVLTAFISLLACAASWNFESWNAQRGLKGYMSLL